MPVYNLEKSLLVEWVKETLKIKHHTHLVKTKN